MSATSSTTQSDEFPAEFGGPRAIMHTIDPDGEVTIVLQNANAPFAVWTEDTPASEQLTTLQPQAPAKSTEEKTENRDIRYKVSAKHLTLASPVFEKALSPNWNEGSTLREQGSVEITVDGWDSQALLILLNIFHCRFNQVPRQISGELLAKIVVLADYYQCISVIEIFAEMWIKAMALAMPSKYGRHLMMWLLICGMLRLSDDCKRLRQIAVKQSTGEIPTLGLPFPGSMIADLNKKREKVINHIIDALYAKVAHMSRYDNDGNPLPPPQPVFESPPRQRTYIAPQRGTGLESRGSSVRRSPETSSSPYKRTLSSPSPPLRLVDRPQRTCFECTSSKLGALIKHMDEMSLSPRPKPPYNGITYELLVRSMNCFKQCERTVGHDRCTTFLDFVTPFRSRLWLEVEAMIGLETES